MLIRTSFGQNIRSYAIFDSDFHTPGQIAARHRETDEKGVSLHIWQRKELENYLLLPEAILRSVAGRVRADGPILCAQLIEDKLSEFASDLEDEIMDALASEFLAENRAGGPAHANRSARERMTRDWNTVQGRLSLASGKMVLARLSHWMQDTYGVAISPVRIARGLHRNEIASEIIDVLTAIENNEPF
jgi:hypothetical protein